MREKDNSLKDGMQEKVMAWCGDDQSLRAEAVDAGPGSRFSIRMRTAMGECQISSPKYGVERIVVERKITLTGEQLNTLADAGLEKEEDVNRMLRGLVASRSSLISCSLERTGDRTTISMSHPVYVDGLTRHSFLSALTDIDRFTTIVDFSLASLKSAARMRRETDEAIKKSQRKLQESVLPTPPETQYVPPPQTEHKPTPPPGAHPAFTSGAHRCSKCGSIADAGDRFCERCGAPLY